MTLFEQFAEWLREEEEREEEPKTLDEADVRYEKANEKYFEETGSQL